MKNLKGLSLLLFLTSSLLTINTSMAADAEGNYAVWGIGKKSCFTYAKARESESYDNYVNYIKGFYTAFNMLAADTYSITGRLSFNEILGWLDDYCELKQMHSLEQALLDFVEEHEDKRLKSPRKSTGR